MCLLRVQFNIDRHHVLQSLTLLAEDKMLAHTKAGVPIAVLFAEALAREFPCIL